MKRVLIMELEGTFQECLGVERGFLQKRVLFIGSESYDAAAVCIIQGLNKLGFEIHTISKGNINSWFCNKVVENPRNFEYDFVLSNLHWGTRWDFYDKYALEYLPRILIDGDDNPRNGLTWRQKHQRYSQRYQGMPDSRVWQKELQPFRWMQPLGGYEPDVVFASQKYKGYEAHYLPFGIQKGWVQSSQKSTWDRKIDFCNVPGGGGRRAHLTKWLLNGRLPGTVHNEAVRGEARCPAGLEGAVKGDRNVHSYHRWVRHEEYFQTLSNSKVFLYPGVYGHAHWDSKRPWEAFACGCYVMFWKPTIEMGEYPVSKLDNFCIFEDFGELLKKAVYLYERPEELERMRVEQLEKAHKYFTAKPLARYFLSRVREVL